MAGEEKEEPVACNSSVYALLFSKDLHWDAPASQLRKWITQGSYCPDFSILKKGFLCRINILCLKKKETIKLNLAQGSVVLALGSALQYNKGNRYFLWALTCINIPSHLTGGRFIHHFRNSTPLFSWPFPLISFCPFLFQSWDVLY